MLLFFLFQFFLVKFIVLFTALLLFLFRCLVCLIKFSFLINFILISLFLLSILFRFFLIYVSFLINFILINLLLLFFLFQFYLIKSFINLLLLIFLFQFFLFKLLNLFATFLLFVVGFLNHWFKVSCLIKIRLINLWFLSFLFHFYSI